MFSQGLVIGKCPFQDRVMCGKNWADCKQVPKTHYSQLNIKGITASKMNVLYHLALQSKVLVILEMETHCIDAEKLELPSYQLAGSSLSSK